MNLTDAHYFQLPSQGNVYSLAKLGMCDGLYKILVASLRRKVYSFEFLQDLAEGFLQPTVKEILFTYIPSGAEIVSIDAFNRSETCDEFVIGITIIKSSGELSQETYLNIYSEWEPSSEFNLDNIAQNCLMLELGFIPYQLYHTNLFIATNDGGHIKEVVWLLSGSDKKVHLFREDRLNHCYCEVNLLDHFAEFTEPPPSVVLWMDVFYCPDLSRRLTAYGCECGFVKLSTVDFRKNVVISSWSSRSDGPVSSVRLFSTEPRVQRPPMIPSPPDEGEPTQLPVHFLVTHTLRQSVVFMDVLDHGLAKCFKLPESNQFDAVLCSCVADINMDGVPEILLGTYGQQLLAYRYKPVDKIDADTEETSEKTENEDGWTLLCSRPLGDPIHCLRHVDLTGDGVRELVVATLHGVHVMQHHAEHIAKVYAPRLAEIEEQFGDIGIRDKEDQV